MKLFTKEVDRPALLIVPFGDIQFTGLNPKTAGGCSVNALTEYLHFVRDMARRFDAQISFIGTGDYVDMMSPSNREAYKASGFYEPNKRIFDVAFADIVVELSKVLLPYILPSEVLAFCMGHHFFNYGTSAVGEKFYQSTDHHLLDLIGVKNPAEKIVPAAGYVEYKFPRAESYCGIFQHGEGNGQSLAYGLNKLDKMAGGFERVDFFVMGHTHKVGSVKKARLSIQNGEIVDHDIRLITSGAFLKGWMKGETLYPEMKQLSPIPLGGSLILARPRIDGSIFSCAMEV